MLSYLSNISVKLSDNNLHVFYSAAELRRQSLNIFIFLCEPYLGKLNLNICLVAVFPNYR